MKRGIENIKRLFRANKVNYKVLKGWLENDNLYARLLKIENSENGQKITKVIYSKDDIIKDISFEIEELPGLFAKFYI